MNCSGNGICVDGISKFTCDCSSGFTGELCETNINDCIEVNCSGNGTCVDGITNFTCDCSPSFTGDLNRVCINGITTLLLAIATLHAWQSIL